MAAPSFDVGPFLVAAISAGFFRAFIRDTGFLPLMIRVFSRQAFDQGVADHFLIQQYGLRVQGFDILKDLQIRQDGDAVHRRQMAVHDVEPGFLAGDQGKGEEHRGVRYVAALSD